jgi:hypothetical protein
MRTLTTMSRNSNSAIGTPSSFQAKADQLAGQSRFDFPFDRYLCLPVRGYQSIITLISLLFAFVSPANVARLIVPVYINAIKGVLGRWPTTQIFKKLLIAFKEEFNSPAPVLWERIVLRVATSRFSRSVCGVFRRQFAIETFSVGSSSPRAVLRRETAARSAVSLAEIRTQDSADISAIATANPEILVFGGMLPTVPNHCPSTVSLTSQVSKVEVCRNWLYVVLAKRLIHTNSLPQLQSF